MLREPEVEKGLRRAAIRRRLSLEKWYLRPWKWLMIRLGRTETENLAHLAEDVLAPLGWPDRRE